MRLIAAIALALALAGCAARSDYAGGPRDPASFGGGIAGAAPVVHY